MLHLHISLRQSPTQRTFLQLEHVSSQLSVADLKKEIATKAGLDASNCSMELIYSCRPMKDESTLKMLEEGNNTVKMIYANIAKPAVKAEAQSSSSGEQHRFIFQAFRTAMTNPNFRQTLQNVSKPENMKILTDTVPGLKEDHIALAMLQDWELLLHLADPKVVQSLMDKHPALLDAAHRVLSWMPGNPEGTHSRRSQSGWLARSLGADMDDDGMDMSGPAPQPGQIPPNAASTITPEQLAAALNLVQNTLRQPQASSSRPDASSSIPSRSVPPAAPRPAPTSATGGLTPEMFNQALMQAMMSSMGGALAGSSGRGAAAATAAAPAPRPAADPPSEDAQLRAQFDRHLPQMRELGITDDSLSLRALQATNGDVQAAVNLIFAGLVDD